MANIRWILSVCVSALIAVLYTAPATAQLNKRCTVDQGRRMCYTLYGSQSDAYTWDEAFESCQNKSSDLVSIEDEQIQNGLVGLTAMLVPLGGMRHVWIAGRRSEDRTWRWVNGDPADGYSFNDPCGYLDMSGSGGALDGFVCYSTSHIEHSLCQYSISQGTCEALGDMSYKGECYRILERRGGLDWNSARQDCRSMVSGAELAYSNIYQFALTQRIQESIGQGVERKIWVGLTSRKWVWKQGTDEIPMVYTKFRGGINLDRFVYFDAGDSGKWAGKDDPAVTSPYYICKSVEVLATTSTTTTTTTTPAPNTTTSPTTAAPIPSPTTPAPTKSPAAQTAITAAQTTTAAEPPTAAIGDTTQATQATITQKDPGASAGQSGPLTETHIIIIGVVGGAIIIMVIVIIAVIVTRGSRRKDNEISLGPTYNNHIDPNTSSVIMVPGDTYNENLYSKEPLDQAEGDSRYEGIAEDRMQPIIEQDEQASVGDGYKMAPEGDIYRLPDKLSRPGSTHLEPVMEDS